MTVGALFDFNGGGINNFGSLETIKDDNGISSIFTPRVQSVNFNGNIDTVNTAIAASLVLVGYRIYLNADKTAVSTSTPTTGDEDFLVVSKADGSTASYVVFTVIIDGTPTAMPEILKATNIPALREDWANKTLGSTGWMITSSGNAIFGNVAVRGTIEATSGYIGDGADVWTINSSSISYSADTNILNYAYNYNFESDTSTPTYGWVPSGTFPGSTTVSAYNDWFEGVYDTGLHSLVIGGLVTPPGILGTASNVGAVFYKNSTSLVRFSPSDFGLAIGNTIAFSIKARSAITTDPQTIYTQIRFYNASNTLIGLTTAGSQSFTSGDTSWKKITTTGLIPTQTATFELYTYSGITTTGWMSSTSGYYPLYYVDNFALNLGSTTPDVLVKEYEISLNATSSESYAIKVLDTATSEVNFGVQPDGTTYSKLFKAPTATFEDLTVADYVGNANLYFQNLYKIPSSITTNGTAGSLILNTDIYGFFNLSGYELTSFFAVKNSNVETFRSNRRGLLIGSSTINTGSNPNTTSNSGAFIDVDGYLSTYVETSAIDTPMVGFFSDYGSSRNRKIMFRSDGRGYFDDVADFGNADYAEYFEWEDGNISDENRIGKSVILLDGKIKIATSLDNPEDIIGIISSKPAVVGDSASKEWYNKYLKDDFKNKLYTLDENGGIVWTINPEFDPEETYIPRENRPEWDAVGLVGKLRVYKDEPKNPRWIKLKDISENVEEWLVR